MRRIRFISVMIVAVAVAAAAQRAWADGAAADTWTGALWNLPWWTWSDGDNWVNGTAVWGTANNAEATFAYTPDNYTPYGWPGPDTPVYVNADVVNDPTASTTYRSVTSVDFEGSADPATTPVNWILNAAASNPGTLHFVGGYGGSITVGNLDGSVVPTHWVDMNVPIVSDISLTKQGYGTLNLNKNLTVNPPTLPGGGGNDTFEVSQGTLNIAPLTTVTITGGTTVGMYGLTATLNIGSQGGGAVTYTSTANADPGGDNGWGTPPPPWWYTPPQAGFVVGAGSGGTASATISGIGTTVTLNPVSGGTTGNMIQVGYYGGGTSTLTINDNASVSAGGLTVGMWLSSGGSGNVVMNGSSKMTIGPTYGTFLGVFDQSVGNMTLNDSASLSAGSLTLGYHGADTGYQYQASGHLILNGSSQVTASSLVLGGTTDSSAPLSTIIVNDNASLTVTGPTTMNRGKITIDSSTPASFGSITATAPKDNPTLEIGSGAQVIADSLMIGSMVTTDTIES